MKRIFIVPAVAILLLQASLAMAQQSTIHVWGQLGGGNQVVATCTIGNDGTISGTGRLYINNNGKYTPYSFTITQGATTPQGHLILAGKINNGGPNMYLDCTFPAGAMVFSYVVNGNTYSLTGDGSVLVE